jgi:hypothetical protein
MDESAPQLICVDPARVAEIWPRVEPLIRAACEKMQLSDLAVLARQLCAGEALLWLAWEPPDIKAAAVTQITLCNGSKLCTIIACGGHGMQAWLPLLAEIDAYAKQQDCRAMRILGRAGWSRVLKDYAVVGHILERRL